jgi:hypothetical protein
MHSEVLNAAQGRSTFPRHRRQRKFSPTSALACFRTRSTSFTFDARQAAAPVPNAFARMSSIVNRNEFGQPL